MSERAEDVLRSPSVNITDFSMNNEEPKAPKEHTLEGEGEEEKEERGRGRRRGTGLMHALVDSA